MLINIIDVGQPNTHAAKNGRNYQSIEVTYKAENGQVANKKLMSFSNPSVFNHIKGLSKGATLNVTTTKDANGYWQWTGIGGDNEVADTTQSKPASGGGRVTGSNYETKEERAARQVYIIRQSSISSAVELVTATSTEPTTVDNVINIAKKFEAYVLAQDPNPTKEVNFDDLEDDIPV
jgi:hypothetical protein